MYMILSYPRTQYSWIFITVHTHCLVTTNGKNSSRGWARTCNLLIRSPALCQLSYTGIYTCYAPIMLYILAVILLEYWGSFVFWGSLRLNLVHRLPTYFNNELHTFENCLKKQLYSSRSTLYPNTKFSMYVPDYSCTAVYTWNDEQPEVHLDNLTRLIMLVPGARCCGMYLARYSSRY